MYIFNIHERNESVSYMENMFPNIMIYVYKYKQSWYNLQMDYNLARDFILGIGWPVLIIGSVYIVFSALLFYKKMGRTPISKLVPILASLHIKAVAT